MKDSLLNRIARALWFLIGPYRRRIMRQRLRRYE